MALRALFEALEDPDPQVRTAVARFAPALIGASARAEALISALTTAEFYGGLTQALLEVEEFHPPAVRKALLHGALHREGEVAVHFAAMLMFIHGKASEAFDWEHRPFFLQFHTEDRGERGAAFLELRARNASSATE